jgi:hypothetical protein
LLVLAAFLITVFGGLLTASGNQGIGLIVSVGGFMSLIASTVWAIRNWNWER